MVSQSNGACLSGDAGKHSPRWRAEKGSSICPASLMGALPGGVVVLTMSQSAKTL